MKPLAFLFAFFFIVTALLLGPSCANIIPPAGGPRDSLPPLLVSATPRDSTLNFRSDRIVFEFDEYVDLQDVPNNVLFTPTFERNPEIAVKGRTITVRFRDTLEANTTYTLSFGNAIRDINEGNIIPGFTYSFSTGAAMDSLEISGKVVLAENGRIDSTLTVLLHRDLSDSAVRLKRPPYITRLDANGNFRFRNLPPGNFAVYALGNAGITRLYQNKNQLFAFLNDPVASGEADSLILYAYREVPASPPAPPTGARGSTGGNRDRLMFFTSLTGNEQDLLGDLSITFPSPLKDFNPGLVNLYTDSVFTPAEHSASLDTSSRILNIKTEWLPGRQYHLVLDRDFASDTTGKKLLVTDTISFTTKKPEDYGSLTIRIRNLNAADNPVLQFVQGDRVIVSVPVGSGNFSQSRFVPGEYDLRILFDRNNNGKWDPGEFFTEKRQPEIARYIDRKITVKPNWQNEFEVEFQ